MAIIDTPEYLKERRCRAVQRHRCLAVQSGLKRGKVFDSLQLVDTRFQDPTWVIAERLSGLIHIGTAFHQERCSHYRLGICTARGCHCPGRVVHRELRGWYTTKSLSTCAGTHDNLRLGQSLTDRRQRLLCARLLPCRTSEECTQECQ